MFRWSRFKFLIGLLAVITIIAFFLDQRPPGKLHENVETQSESKRIEIDLNKFDKYIDSTAKEKPEQETSVRSTKDESHSVLVLTAGNFTHFVLRCFQGEPCELAEDPMKLYDEFKLSGDRRAADNLISFLRKQLKDPRLKEQYKESLLKMIQDFYSPEEKQFQEAAYYNYLGDLEKSLALYLDLEKKALNDPSLRSAPKLNIANTFYDLGRLQEALPYYQSALNDYLSRREQVIVPDTNDMVRFIEERIEEIHSNEHR